MNKPSGHILAVHPSAELYGADRILAECLACLSDWDITLIVPRDGPLIPYLRERFPALEIVIDPTLPVIARKFSTIPGTIRFLKNWIRFAWWLKQKNGGSPLQLLYVSTMQTFSVSVIARLLRIPCVVHVHEILERPRAVFEITTSVVALCANRVICVSSAVRRNLLRNSRAAARPEQFIVVHNGIREIAHPPASGETVQDHGRIVFSLFGRIKPEKGQWFLVEALAQLTQEELSRIEVNIVGGVVSGKEHLVGELSDKIERAGLKGLVSVLPFTQDISALLRMSDVCLIPSIMEDPFPTTVLEAMAAGKPVIATTVGGIPEMITHGTDGLLCSPRSPEELASCVRLVLNRPDMVRILGANARCRFEESFTIEQFTRRFRVAVLGGCDGATRATP